MLALVQDRDPAEPRLRALEDQELEEPRSSCTGTPHSASWYACISGSLPAHAQRVVMPRSLADHDTGGAARGVRPREACARPDSFTRRAYDPYAHGRRFPNRRVLLLLAVLAVAGVVAYSIARGVTGTSDFKNPYRVARIFWETGELDIRREPRYPPTIRVLLAPLAALPLGVAAAVWTHRQRPGHSLRPAPARAAVGHPGARAGAGVARRADLRARRGSRSGKPSRSICSVTWGLVCARRRRGRGRLADRPAG